MSMLVCASSSYMSSDEELDEKSWDGRHKPLAPRFSAECRRHWSEFEHVGHETCERSKREQACVDVSHVASNPPARQVFSYKLLRKRAL